MKNSATSIALLAFAAVLLPLAAHGQAELDPNTIKAVEQKNPPRLELHFRLTELQEVAGVEAVAGGQALPVQFTPYAKDAISSEAFLFVIDISDPARAKTIAACKALVLRLINQAPPQCKFAVYTLAANLEPVAEFGATKEEVAAKLKAVKPEGIVSELFRGSIDAIKVLGAVDATRKALVILSDGRALDTTFDAAQTIDKARETGVTIFGIGYAERPQWSVFMQSMRRLAGDTGGQFGAADIATKKEPEELTSKLFDYMQTGGTAVADLSGLKTGEDVDFAVKTKDGRVLKYSFKLVELKPTPTPAPIPVPTAAPAPTSTPPPSTPVPTPKPTPTPKRQAYLEKQHEIPPGRLSRASLAGLVAAGVLALLLLVLTIARKRGKSAAAETPAPARVYARLQLLDSNPAEYPMHATAMRIGRGPDNDIVLQNDSISRHHAEIHRKGDGTFTITDLAAGNGVLVNGVQLKQATLKNEDIIELGEVRLRFLVDESKREE